MFVLHVGPHKTATTWLQHNFYANARALADAGWLYPATGERVRVAHHDISDNPADILDDGSRKVAELKAIAARARARGLHVLMSSEGFRNWKPDHLARLQALIGQEMRIVYCLRDPASLLYSFWAQRIKTGFKTSFPDYAQRQLALGVKSRILNAGVELRLLSGLAGVDLTILLYDEIARQKRDIFDVFVTDILNMPALPHVAESAAANDQVPIEIAEFMRLMLIRTGDWRAHADVNIGRVFRYMVAGSTRKKIEHAVAAVSSARGEMLIDRALPVFARIEQGLLKTYHPLMTPQPSTDRLFLDGERLCVFYDEAILAEDPSVARLLDRLARAFRPGGIRLLAVNWGRRGLTAVRRLLKRLRG